ncbi:MAG: hypothetical protein GX363_05880 [Clostridiales bacterium]|nr:hypothetical protein [Clostridiales bacterium]
MSKRLICSRCNSNSFEIKYEATYVYSYLLDSDAPGLKNREEFLSYMYDNREQKSSKQYIECRSCKTRYPCYYTEWKDDISVEGLQRIIDQQF